MDEVSAQEARAALATVERGRLSVVERIAVPAWYWWFVAAGWVVLGILGDLGNPWVTSTATLLFGALHAGVAPRVVSGRHGSGELSVRAEVAGGRVTVAVLGGLVLLTGVTVGAAFALSADGSGHPATGASVLAAVIVLLGGPMLIARVRRTARLAGAP
ncbi:hypothetical protein CC117_23645 [Parafrankia colletiae]|uniref:Transmembrane protein n=1 Tax=Parafrankia colletiae TaxID=573497 RepID=A0A1S1QIC8_9ACTN|nr:hypothetical protein [Parafrankia colletiae]MCK9904674.1 hypothetical protein [Frankia sp. Cpl3]OHV33171.1 hypothetical protein CC117_23645 [Parafrankia colletiae]